MVKLLSSVTIILSFFIQVIHCEVNEYTCEIIKKEGTESNRRNWINYHSRKINVYGQVYLLNHVCFLTGLHLTLSDKNFLPVTYHPINEIEVVLMKDSKLEVLTDDVCEAFPSIEAFDAAYLGLISIDETAFQKCTKVEIVGLNSNSLTSLPPKIFYWNVKLTTIDLSYNKLTSIDENLFQENRKLSVVNLKGNRISFLPMNLFINHPNLRELCVSANQLRELSFFGVFVSLTTIFVDRNKLSNIDIEMLHNKFPNLKRFVFHHNELLCDRKTKIIEFLEKSNIEYGELIIENEEKPDETDEFSEEHVPTDALDNECIKKNDSWEIRKLLRWSQFEVFQDITQGFVTKGDLSGLKSEIASLVIKVDHMGDLQCIIFIILGSMFIIVFIVLGVNVWMIQKLLCKPDKSEGTAVQPTNLRLNQTRAEQENPDRRHQPVTRPDSYYEYIPGFNQSSGQPAIEPTTYDRLRFN